MTTEGSTINGCMKSKRRELTMVATYSKASKRRATNFDKIGCHLCFFYSFHLNNASASSFIIVYLSSTPSDPVVSPPLKVSVPLFHAYHGIRRRVHCDLRRVFVPAVCRLPPPLLFLFYLEPPAVILSF